MNVHGGLMGSGSWTSRWKSALTLALVSLITIAAGKQPVEPHPRLNSQDVKAVATIASYIEQSRVGADTILEGVGFKPPPPTPSVWASFSEMRKIEFAYLAALDVNRVEAEKMLATMSETLARSHESVRSEVALKEHLGRPDITENTRVTFSKKASIPEVNLDPSVKRAIHAISGYADGGALGGVQGVLRDYYGLSFEQVDDILRRPGTASKWLEQGLSLVPESKRTAAIQSVTTDLARRFESVHYAPDLHPYMDGPTPNAPPDTDPRPPQGADGPSKKPQGPGGDGPSPRTGPASGPGPQHPPAPSVSGGGNAGSVVPRATGTPHIRPVLPRTTGHTVRYDKFVQKSYPKSVSRDFRTVSRMRGGLGGVIFGNTVTAACGTPCPTLIRWIPGRDDPDLGSLLVHIPGEETLTLPYVRAEDARVAAAIVFGDKERAISPHIKGTAIGLVGILAKAMYAECDEHGGQPRGTIFQVLVTPAAVDTDLGWTFAMCDALPTARVAMKAMASAAGFDEEAMKPLNTFLSSPGGTWKFVDAPTKIVRLGRRLDVERDDANGSPTILLDMNSFDIWTEKDEPRLNKDFAEAAPLLVRASRDFQRLNDFARVMAVVRWTQAQGAEWSGALPPLADVPTPELILSTQDGVGAWLGGNPDLDRAKCIETRMAAIRAEAEDVAALNDLYAPRRSQARAAYGRLMTVGHELHQHMRVLNEFATNDTEVNSRGLTLLESLDECDEFFATFDLSAVSSVPAPEILLNGRLASIPEVVVACKGANASMRSIVLEMHTIRDKCLRPSCAIEEFRKTRTISDDSSSLIDEWELLQERWLRLDHDGTRWGADAF